MKINTNHLITRLAVAATVIFSISSCKKDNDEDLTLNSKLSFVNTVEGSVAQDVYINDLKVNTSAVAYTNTVTDVNTSSGSKTLSFKNTGTATVAASANISAEANSSHTVFLVKQANGSLAVNTYANDETTTSGKAKVRFINVAPLLSNAINVTTSVGTNLVSNLLFRTASAYQTVDANTSLNITMTGSLEVTTIAGSELQAGKNYIIWFDSSTSTKAKYHIVIQK
ncbi:DUF4397 domain-containing protein [Pedobacter xixiisoli]|uniref:DUF4397 domain-containing protein n=1 Tax=Pedobacter xixiisoli TaxID=1476464 RepID=A0A285ZZS2_9SPHI|nr:DUF4397 domain-containing protein [Pedobacter xixiisoli]SOD15166.1 protein of unknown function [Pedobacter xixiisoli]